MSTVYRLVGLAVLNDCLLVVVLPLVCLVLFAVETVVVGDVDASFLSQKGSSLIVQADYTCAVVLLHCWLQIPLERIVDDDNGY